VQSDALNSLITDTVLVAVTGKARSASTEVLLDPAVESKSGLSQVSSAICNNLSTTDQGLIYRRLGELSAVAMQRIEARIKAALELP
jgi:mRNA-degrading endonuclease toxin of MazEF toxin-antitoxin module